MYKSVLSFSTFLFAAVVFAPVGRSNAQAIPVPVHPGPVARMPQVHQPPCWQEAGISKSAMEERQAIQRRTKAEVEAVCAETSLTPQQRQQKIQQIHQQAKQELDATATPEQLEALKSCQMSRNHGGVHPVGHPVAGGGHGPCGELPAGGNPPKAPSSPPGGKAEPEVEN